MPADPEAVSQALASVLSLAQFPRPIGAAASWVTFSRRLRLWGEVPAEERPACFLVEHEEEERWSGSGRLDKRTLVYSVFCYAAIGEGEVGATAINTMLSAVRGALAPRGRDMPGGEQTLGGLVTWCRVEGRVFKDPGDLDGDAMLVAPIRVLCP